MKSGTLIMTSDGPDKRLRAKIAEAFVPADLCSTDPAAIEALLDAVKAKPFPEDTVQRMLKKLRGELPIGKREQVNVEDGEEDEYEETAWRESELSEVEKELVALYRNGKGDLPPSVKEKLRKLREEAKRNSVEGEEGEN